MKNRAQYFRGQAASALHGVLDNDTVCMCACVCMCFHTFESFPLNEHDTSVASIVMCVLFRLFPLNVLPLKPVWSNLEPTASEQGD